MGLVKIRRLGLRLHLNLVWRYGTQSCDGTLSWELKRSMKKENWPNQKLRANFRNMEKDPEGWNRATGHSVRMDKEIECGAPRW